MSVARADVATLTNGDGIMPMPDETPLRRWLRWHEGEIAILVLLVIPVTLMWTLT